ncbi:MAG TPA: hypothetical protein VIU44_08120 [Gaiellaceae bacterium]
MATVIDELVVLLGLDASKFSDEQKKVAAEYVRLKENASRSTKDAQKHTDDLTGSFAALQGRLLGIAALFLGGMGIKQFAEQVAQLTSQLGRAGQQAGVTAADLSAYGNLGRGLGANPQSVRSAVAGMAAAGNSPTVNPQFWQAATAMGITPGKLPNGDLDVNKLLVDMSRFVDREHARGVGDASITQRLNLMPGMNADMVSVLLQGSDKMIAALEAMKKFGPTPEQVAAVQTINKAWAELQAKMEQTARVIETQLAPVLVKVIKIIEDVVGAIDNRAKVYKSPEEAARALSEQRNQPFGASPGSPWSRWMGGIRNWWNGTPSSSSTGGAAAPPNGQSVVSMSAGGGVIDRSRFAAELASNPALRDKVMAIAAGENNNPRANMSVMETMMNRAAMAHTTLAAQARTTAEGGYYAGYNPAAARDPRRRAILEQHLATVLAGSNVSNYATDNSSQGLAAREKATGKFTLQAEYGGESFFSPGWGGGAMGPRSRAAYEAWRKSVATDTKLWDNARAIGASSPGAIDNSRSSETHVHGGVHVYTDKNSAYDIAGGIHGALIDRANSAGQSDTGPW